MKVIFDIVKSGNTIVYPDNKELFSNTEEINGRMTSDYSGSLELEEYTPQAEELIISVNEFYNLFTLAEQSLWFAFIETGVYPGATPAVEVAAALLIAKNRINGTVPNGFDLNSELASASVGAMELASFIATGRGAEILSNTPP